jgi:hypothetical protein
MGGQKGSGPMLYVTFGTLSESVGVSRLTVLRWKQTGWLKGPEGLVELDTLPRLIDRFSLNVDLEKLRTSAIELPPEVGD